MQPSIAVARLLTSQLHQRLAQFDVAVRPRLVPIARPLHAQQLAGRVFAQPKLDLADIAILDAAEAEAETEADTGED